MKAKIYSKLSCPFCVRAKEILTANEIPYDEIIVDGINMTREQMVLELNQGELSTVPQVTIDGQFIPGGYTGLVRHFGGQ